MLSFTSLNVQKLNNYVNFRRDTRTNIFLFASTIKLVHTDAKALIIACSFELCALALWLYSGGIICHSKRLLVCNL